MTLRTSAVPFVETIAQCHSSESIFVVHTNDGIPLTTTTAGEVPRVEYGQAKQALLAWRRGGIAYLQEESATAQ